MLRRIRDNLIAGGAKLESDKAQVIELDNGARVLALPENDNSIRGLDGRWLDRC